MKPVMNMREVRVLLSSGISAENYVQAIEALGAQATVQYCGNVDLNYDGLIVCGGYDVHPRYYDEPMAGTKKVDEELDRAEFALIKAYVQAGKPVLGVCRGCQILNVYFGGSLVQDLENAKEHSSGIPGCDLIHGVTAEKGSIAEKLYGENFVVNSSHHQAIKVPGKGVRITMYSADGRVIEGFEHESLPVFAVQWHPERMCFAKKREDTVDGSKIIGHFLEICRQHKCK